MSSHRIILGLAIVGSALAILIPNLPAQVPGNPMGIDVYNGTGTINWTSVKNSGVSFAFLKATEGIGFQDALYPTYRTQAKAQGIVIGAYHFARPSTSPSAAARGVAEANYFINYAQPQKGEFQLVLDFEATGGLSQANLWTWIQAFCGQIKTVTNRPAIIYCSPSFWNDNLPTTATNMNCGLWVANWRVSSPSLPRAWTSYSFWQYNDLGAVPGVSGNCDVDTFNGSMTSLLKFTYPRDPMAGRR